MTALISMAGASIKGGRLWQNRRRRQAVAAGPLTTCPPSFKKLLTPLATMTSVDNKTPNGLSFRYKSNFVEHETLQPKMCCSEARPKKWWLDL